MATIGTLSLTLTANISKFEKGLKKAARQLSNTGRMMRNMGLGITAAVGSALYQFASFGDGVAKMARRTALSVKAVSELGYVSKIAGSSMEAVEKGVRRMARAITDANSGLLTYQRAFTRIGLDAADLAKMAPEEAFWEVARAIGGTKDALIRASAAQEIFGRAGTQLIPMFDMTAKEMDTLRERAEKLGVIMGPDGALKAEQLADALTDARQAVIGVSVAIATNLGIQFDQLSDKIANGTKAIRTFIAEHRGGLQWISKFGIAALAGGSALMAVGTMAKYTAWALAGVRLATLNVAKAFTFLAGHPMMLVVAAGVAVGVGITKLLDKLGITHSYLQTMADKSKVAADEQRALEAALLSSAGDMERMAAGALDAADELTGMADAASSLKDAMDALKVNPMEEWAKELANPAKDMERIGRAMFVARTALDKMIREERQLGFASDENLEKRRKLLESLTEMRTRMEAIQSVWGEAVALPDMPGVAGQQNKKPDAIDGVARGSAGAFDKGSREAYSVALQPQLRAADAHFKDAQKMREKQLDEQIETNDLLARAQMVQMALAMF